jgi:outer membrane protein OmpA-like peptidoglycan-associated protein
MSIGRTARARARIAALLILISLGASAAEPPVGTAVSFVSCPIARDTGEDTDLCFLAEHDGFRYALVNPPDWGVPQLKHRVLVEGRVKEGPPVCGAIPIDGRASVLREIDESCSEIVPFDGVLKGEAGGVFSRGTPQQRAFARDLEQRAAVDPSLSIEPAILDPPPTPPPVPPFEPRTLVITYPFDSNRGSGPDMVKLQELAVYARVANAKRVGVVGYRATSRLADGSEMIESPELAQARARKIAGILGALGVEPRVTAVSWVGDAIAARGSDDWRNRKVEVTVTP